MNLSYVGWGGAVILFAGLFDMMDGRLARVSGRDSKFGAMYDSVLDRYSELVMFLGICYYLVAHHYFFSSLFAFLAMIGSIMVSYVRARAEGLGIECSDGLMQRPERILLIGISAILCGMVNRYYGTFNYSVDWFPYPLLENINVFTFPIMLLAFLANWTAWQRLQSSRRALEQQA
jgi:CDP-diacylglycerol---glycerol-3-phosphate 3-phosphatidyltransferase